jgi:hypothetical protein
MSDNTPFAQCSVQDDGDADARRDSEMWKKSDVSGRNDIPPP